MSVPPATVALPVTTRRSNSVALAISSSRLPRASRLPSNQGVVQTILCLGLPGLFGQPAQQRTAALCPRLRAGQRQACGDQRAMAVGQALIAPRQQQGRGANEAQLQRVGHAMVTGWARPGRRASYKGTQCAKGGRCVVPSAGQASCGGRGKSRLMRLKAPHESAAAAASRQSLRKPACPNSLTRDGPRLSARAATT